MYGHFKIFLKDLLIKLYIDILLNQKADGKIKAEAELVNLRKEVLLLGEMQRRYREKMSIPRAGEQEQVN